MTPRGKHGQGRLRWVSQQCAEKPACIRRLKRRTTEAIPLVKHIPMAFEIDRHALTNRVPMFFETYQLSLHP
jgi:hypothetical protein